MKDSKFKFRNMLFGAMFFAITSCANGCKNDVINVKDFGAKGDGKADDTEAIQKTIDQTASKGGGKVYVPDGVYMIRADVPSSTQSTKYLLDEGGIALQDNIHLILSQGTRLKAFPSSRNQYVIVRIYAKNNVTIEGGTIEGERYEHSGTTGEWGYGIAVSGGKDIVIKNLTAKDCWGDGINLKNLQAKPDAGIPPEEYLPVNVTIDNVRCLNNRRQGLSIEGGLNLRVSGSEFSFTNGTGPAAGIDIEPAQDHHFVRNLRVENCLFQENASSGVMVLYQATDGVEVSGCTFINNKDSEAQSKTWDKCKNVTVRNCHFERINGTGTGNGILFQNAENLTAYGNTLVNNIFVLRTVGNGILKNVTIHQNSITLKESVPHAFASGGNIDKLTVIENTFDFNHPGATAAEYIELCGKNLVFSNNILLAVDNGINVSNAPNAKIQYNAIHGSSISAGQISNSPNAVFLSNVISGAGHSSGAASFRILAGSDHTRIVNNQFYQTSQIPVSGTGKSHRALSIAPGVEGIVLEGNNTYPAVDNFSYPIQ